MPKKHFIDKTKKISINGYDLWLVASKGYASNVSLQRIQHNRDFANKFFELASKESPPDLIVSPIPTIENASMSYRLAKKWGIPIVADIRDEWPDELVNVAPRPLRFMARFLLANSFRKMKKFCRSVDGIMGVTQRQVAYGLNFARREFDKKKDHVFPLGYPSMRIDGVSIDRAKETISFDFSKYKLNVCFFGTLGRYFEFESLVLAARQLPEVGFVIAGDGDFKSKVHQQLAGLSNVYCPGWINPNQIRYIAQNCQVGLAPYVGSEAFTMPNKIFEYLSNGLVLLTTIKGELSEIMNKHEIGLHFEPYNGASLQKAIEFWLGDSELLKKSQIAAKNLFESEFSQEIIFARAEAYLESFIGRKNER